MLPQTDSRPWLPLLLALGATVALACAKPQVKTAVIVPARTDATLHLRRIAVVPFEGPRGQDLAARLQNALAGVAFQGARYFTIIERESLDAVLREQRFGLGSHADPRTTARLGTLVGAQALLVGEMEAAGTRDQADSEQRQVCVAKDQDGVCTRYANRTFPCTRRSAHVVGMLRLVDASTGEVAWSARPSLHRQSTDCGFGRLESPGAMMAPMLELVVAETMKDLAPHRVVMELDLMKADDLVKRNPDVKEAFEGALEFAKKGRMDRACSLWARCAEDAPDATPVVFNQAVCSEVQGNLAQALSLFQKAEESLLRPDDQVSEAIRRVEARMAQQRRLDQQLETGAGDSE